MTAMFAGIGVLRTVWMPLLDLAPETLNLGAVLYLPVFIYMLIVSSIGYLLETLEPILGQEIMALIYNTLGYILVFFIVIIGMTIFTFGVMTWLYGKFQGKEVIDFWIYKYSRHPQYLGIIIWNYGLLILSPISILGIGTHPPPPTFPWLVLALVIVGMAMNEENKMVRKYSEDYLNWREQTAFMIPVPKRIRSIIKYPMLKTIKKEWPENNKDMIIILLIYGGIVVLMK